MMRYDKFKSNNSAPSFLIFRNLSLDPTPSPPGIKLWFRLPKYLQLDLRLSFPKPRQTSTIVLFSQNISLGTVYICSKDELFEFYFASTRRVGPIVLSSRKFSHPRYGFRINKISCNVISDYPVFRNVHPCGYCCTIILNLIYIAACY